VFLESPATFEIRRIRAGELSAQFGPFHDGTLADRFARELGQDWRVFRQEASSDWKPTEDLDFASIITPIRRPLNCAKYPKKRAVGQIR
jgi:hypothetical protein